YTVNKDDTPVGAAESTEGAPPIIRLINDNHTPIPKYSRRDNIATPYQSNIFPVPPELRPRVDFWKDVYTLYTTKQVVIHSSINPHIIYKVVDISNQNGQTRGYSSRAVQNEIKREKRRIVTLLEQIHHKNKTHSRLSKEEMGVASLFSLAKTQGDFLAESRNIRSQLGQSDRFVEGIRRSGRYLDKMKEIFKDEGVPVELTALPHVESSFNYEAYSSAGAMGIWQFMRSTGKQFMRIDYVVDERRDPLVATRGAARLLKQNYATLGNWPLAVTAYNHGLQGMKRAQNNVGNNIAEVIDNHKGKYFGFASKNFYSSFMAAVEIMQDPSRYFGPIELYVPIEYQTINIDRYISVNTLGKHLGLSKKEIASYNPALRKPVIEGTKHIPRGYALKVPKGRSVDYVKLYASIPSGEKYAEQKPSEWYSVGRGDTLSGMARQFGTSVPALMAMNDLDSVHRIYVGQILRVTGKAPPHRAKPEVVETASISTPPSSVKTDQVVTHHRTTTKVAEVRERFSRKLYEFLSPATANARNVGYGYIRIEPEETLGHYSEWSGMSAASLRRLNGIKSKRYPMVIGRKIKIPFTNVAKETFEERRAEYHLALQEDYFSSYQVKETMAYQMRSGDTIWSISTKDEIPIWLLKWYNPEANLHALKVGDTLTVPLVSARESTPEKI
ncbi:MAG: transglycosylase SLT domain-containing protein, partial [Nitrospinae bacterium]|nr:transglycosylase SLT domain-containing protein [Nitrospinota bacterium]